MVNGRENVSHSIWDLLKGGSGIVVIFIFNGAIDYILAKTAFDKSMATNLNDRRVQDYGIGALLSSRHFLVFPCRQ